MNESSSDKYSNWLLIKDLIRFIRPYKGRFLIGTLMRLTSDIGWLFPAYALGSILNFLTEYKIGNDISPIYPVFTIWIIVSIWRFTGNQWSKNFIYRIAEQAKIDLYNQTVKHMLISDTAWHEKENTGNKMKRIQEGAEGVNKLIRVWVNNIIVIVVNLLGAAIILFYKAPLFGVIFGVFIIVNIILLKLLTPQAIRAAKRVSETEESYAGLSYEMISNVRTVKISRAQGNLQKKLEEVGRKLSEVVYIRIKKFRIREIVIGNASQVFRLGGSMLVVYGITKGWYEVGLFVMYYSYFNAAWSSLDEVSSVSQDISVSRISIGRVKKLLAAPALELVKPGERKFPKQWESLNFKNVTFGYGENEILKNISLEVKRGEKVGIVGLSGAGKSTLFKLLLKEYENYTGEILVGNSSIKEIGHAEYFKNVAVVLQETEVFNFSLRDNVTIANIDKEKDDKLLKKALGTSHVLDFIHKLPEREDTFIGEKGVKLSGGEKQRLGIARAIFKRPQILLLDEATSHLDVESEKDIQESLHEFFKEVTAIVIAHRLTTVREMDKIVVVEDGRILEEGSFSELQEKKGRFFELWEKQKI